MFSLFWIVPPLQPAVRTEVSYQACGRLADAGGTPVLVRGDGTVVVVLDDPKDPERFARLGRMIGGRPHRGDTLCVELSVRGSSRSMTSAWKPVRWGGD